MPGSRIADAPKQQLLLGNPLCDRLWVMAEGSSSWRSMNGRKKLSSSSISNTQDGKGTGQRP